MAKKIYKNGKNTNQPWRGSKITADGDCSHQIKRLLLLGRKAMTNLDSILKSRDITLPTEVHLVKAMVFPVVMYGCESWPIKKVEHWRIDAFQTVVLEKTLESPLDCQEIKSVNSKGNHQPDLKRNRNAHYRLIFFIGFKIKWTFRWKV